MKQLPQFLTDLAFSLRAATAAQLGRHYFGGNMEALHRALRAAKARGFIEVSTELVRPWKNTGTPIAKFQMGERTLPAGHVAYQASRRWNDTPAPTLVIRATTTLATLQGGTARTIATGHLSHEIAITEVFLNKRVHDPRFEWSLVQSRPGTGVLPDAIAGSLACEVIGRYGNATVAAKLTLAASMNLEIW